MKLRKGDRVSLIGSNVKGKIVPTNGKIFLDKAKMIVQVEFTDGVRANILRPLLKKAA